MHINSFMMNPDDVNTHSNHYAGGTASEQSFSERLKIEKQRKVIGAYQQSQIGTSFVTRGEYVRKKIRVPGSRGEKKHTRQEMNAGGGTFSDIPERQAVPKTRQQMNSRAGGAISFREPPSRGYNPYS